MKYLEGILGNLSFDNYERIEIFVKIVNFIIKSLNLFYKRWITV